MPEEQNGVSLFGRTLDLVDGDPMEEIFALNLGDFISEYLISDDLANKIGSDIRSKSEKLTSQLKELISIYSLDNTLKVLGFNSKEEYVIYNAIAKTLTQILDIDACHIYLTKEFAREFQNSDKDLPLVGTSLDFEYNIYDKDLGYKLSRKNLAVNAFKHIKTIEIENVSESELFKPIKELDEEKVKSALAVPMHNNANIVGVVVIENYKLKKIKKVYIKLLESIAGLFGTSLSLQKSIDETQELLEDEAASVPELQHQRAELTALIGDLGDYQQAFVEKLVKAVDEKGQYKVAHSQNVAKLAKKICNQLKLNEKTTDLIYYAGLLQNIGRITLPEALFASDKKLTKDEWEKLQNHPNVGVNLLMNINFLSEVIPYIHYHKERWDGRGEPEGLKGNSIPLGSRIIAVADAYSAMISDRAYRKAMSKEQAIDIIKEESGAKWDPLVVDALLDVLRKSK